MEKEKEETIECGLVKPDLSDFKQTGACIENNRHIKKKSPLSIIFSFSTKDLILLSIIGIMGGFISALVPFSLLIKTWFPLVGGTQLVSGHHLLWMVIGYGLTKKKNAILYVGTIKGFIDFLIGSQWGVLEIFINLYEGFFLIVGFYVMENIFKEKNTFLGYGIAGGLGNMTQVPLFWLLSGRIYIFPISLFIMAIMFGFASGVVISGILGKMIIDRIEKAGIHE